MQVFLTNLTSSNEFAHSREEYQNLLEWFLRELIQYIPGLVTPFSSIEGQMSGPFSMDSRIIRPCYLFNMYSSIMLFKESYISFSNMGGRLSAPERIVLSARVAIYKLQIANLGVANPYVANSATTEVTYSDIANSDTTKIANSAKIANSGIVNSATTKIANSATTEIANSDIANSATTEIANPGQGNDTLYEKRHIQKIEGVARGSSLRDGYGEGNINI
ncbi:hypothetical protein Tco_0143810 [Tanacetum coccineum]